MKKTIGKTPNEDNHANGWMNGSMVNITEITPMVVQNKSIISIIGVISKLTEKAVETTSNVGQYLFSYGSNNCIDLTKIIICSSKTYLLKIIQT